VNNWILTAAACLPIALCAPAVASEAVTLASPDGRNSVTVTLDAQGRPTYSVARDGKPILAPSPIGLRLDSGLVGIGMSVTGEERTTADTRYPLVAGKAAEARDHYNALTLHLAESAGAKRRMDLVLRAYDDGVAFRTVLPVQDATAAALVRGEETEFRFPKAFKCWGFNVGRFDSAHEGEYDPVDTTKIRPHNLFDLPFLCETGTAAFALTEADLVDFSGMYLTARADAGLGLRAKLSPALDDKRVAVRTHVGAPIVTPWRVVMLADRAGKLNESTLVTNLAAPSRVADTSWIRPGKSTWDWWNGPTVAAVAKPGSNTATARAFIDLAAANGLEYATIDEGWYAGAGGGGLVRPGADVTRPGKDFDLEQVVAYAREKGVRLWLWVNWQALDAQMEEALALYSRLGIAGIKVDFMDRDDQGIVNWYAKLLDAAARHRLMVNLHGAYVPRGLNRTYPNFITQEGVLGAEYNKWTYRITAGHNVMLAYTRNLLGPMDYTPGGFRNVSPADFQIRNELPFVQTTRAHGLAMYVVYESPLAEVSDSPDTYAANSQGLGFIREVPTRWDETRFLAGEVGAYIAIARRKGERWYVGVLNGDAAHKVVLPLAQLGGTRYRARIWSDGARPDAVTFSERQVGGDLTLQLPATGGATLTLDPDRTAPAKR